MKKKDTYFNNLKAIMIFLVVLGHFTNLIRYIPLIGAIENVIYSFHMPVFIFISGYFSKNITSHRATEIEKILYPYIVFQIINYVFIKLTGLGYGTSINIFTPIHQNWYLLGLLIWRILIPYYNFFNKKYSLFLTILLSFTIGFFDEFGMYLGLYRIIYFFPIFILGYYCSDLKTLINKYSKYKYYFICISLLSLFAIFLASFFNDKINNAIYIAYLPFDNYLNSIHIFFLRIIGFFSSLLISFGLLFIIPQKELKITYIGDNTLNIYLLHMFFVFPLNYYLVNVPSYLILIISFFSSVLICILLSNGLINKILTPLTNFKHLKLLFKKLHVMKK